MAPTTAQLNQRLIYQFTHEKSILEQFGVSPGLNRAIGLGATVGAAGAAGLLEDSTAAAGAVAGTDARTAEEAAAGRGAGGLAGAGGGAAGLASSLAKDATAGAVLGTLLSGDGLKYGAIWVGLLVLGVGLIFLGLSKSGAKVPTPIVVAP